MLVLQPPRAAVGRWSRGSRRHRAPLRGQAEQRGELRVCPTLRSEAGRASPPQGVGRRRGALRAGRRVPGQCAPGRTALALAVGMGALQRGRVAGSAGSGTGSAPTAPCRQGPSGAGRG